jgi:hypothetical protein
VAALSISRAWDETKAVLRRDGRLYTTVALAMFVLPGVVAELVTPRTTAAGELPAPGLWTILSILALLVSLVGQLAVCRLAIGPVISVGEAIGHGARRAPAYVAAALMWVIPFLIVFAVLGVRAAPNPETMSAGVALGVLVFLIAFLLLAVRFLLASPVASAEPLSPIGILRRSWNLTRGHWWKLFGFLVLFLIALIVLLTAVGAVVGTLTTLAFGEAEPLSVGTLLVSLATQLIAASITVVLMIMLARIYAQLTGSASEASVPHAP